MNSESNPPRPLPPEALRRRAPLEEWKFQDSSELPHLEGALGQKRAEEALDFGVSMLFGGYNLVAIGPPQLGKHSIIEERLQEAASRESPPADLCYLHNFSEPRRPVALSLPPRRGRELKEQLKAVISQLKEKIPKTLGSEDYQGAEQLIEENFRERQEEALEALQQEAEEYGIAVIQTPSGVVMAPTSDGEVLPPAEFQERPREERDQFEENLKRLHRQLESSMGRFPGWEQERSEKLEELRQNTLSRLVSQALLPLRTRFAGLSKVEDYCNALIDDILENSDAFVDEKAPLQGRSPFGQPELSMASFVPDPFQRYGVNLLIESANEGAPVVREHNPTLENLVGRIDHQAHFGALRTDYSMVQPGALHKANGGYLIVDARDLLRHPFGWEQLKRALRSEEVSIESPAELSGLVSTLSLEPEPFDLKVKVILVADPLIFELLTRYDPDMEDLFKVIVDFSADTDRKDKEDGAFLSLLARLIGEERLPPFEIAAMGALVEEASRMTGDAGKLTLKTESLRDLLCESAHFAGQSNSNSRGNAREEKRRVSLDAVQEAIRAREYRRNRLKKGLLDSIRRDHLHIETRGAVIGQVNGLSVLNHAGFHFGIPSRITASVRLGSGEVVDIAREVAMSGPVHSRGVLILSGFLGQRFGQNRPLSLHASLVFEQTYGPVDGDSASLGEAIALLSALGKVPLYQHLAITGSIDQWGAVQAVGGVNEKIEGFFDTCLSLGELTGQGVIIPFANGDHLMLRPDVIEAVEAGAFQVYLADHINQALELLTGLPAGEPDQEGHYDPMTLYGRVDRRLDHFADRTLRWRSK